MKNRILLLCLFLLFIISVSGCQPSSPTPSEPKESFVEPDFAVLAEEILELGKFPEMLIISENRLPKFFDLDAEQLESFAVYVCAEAILSDEIVLLRAKNIGDVDDIQKKVEARFAAQKKSFDDYLPKEGEKIGNAIFFKSNRDTLFVITENPYIEDITAHIEQVYQPD